MSNRALGDSTGQNAETVRRYMQGAAPSVEFLAALCARFDLSAQWLLTGRGPMRQSETRAFVLRQANPAELLSAIAEALERLTDRVDRIELFVQTLETRLRANRSPVDHGARIQAGASNEPVQEGDSVRPPSAEQGVAALITDRARHLAGALAQRPSQNPP